MYGTVPLSFSIIYISTQTHIHTHTHYINIDTIEFICRICKSMYGEDNKHWNTEKQNNGWLYARAMVGKVLLYFDLVWFEQCLNICVYGNYMLCRLANIHNTNTHIPTGVIGSSSFKLCDSHNAYRQVAFFFFICIILLRIFVTLV